MTKFRIQSQCLACNDQQKMGKLTPELRGRLTWLVDAGMTIKDAALDVGCSQNAAGEWIRRHRAGEGLKDRVRSGYPRVTSAAQDASIMH